MMNPHPKANYEMVDMSGRGDVVCLRDVGPWDVYMTVTNAAEEVVKDLLHRGLLRHGQRLCYYDSEGHLDEIVVERGRFQGFKPWRETTTPQMKHNTKP